MNTVVATKVTLASNLLQIRILATINAMLRTIVVRMVIAQLHVTTRTDSANHRASLGGSG
jgi:hypothetical protein